MMHFYEPFNVHWQRMQIVEGEGTEAKPFFDVNFERGSWKAESGQGI